MDKTYQVKVFGKKGCAKCKTLNERLDKLLAQEEWQDFAKAYSDVETEVGLVDFCKAQCVNPSRIPAMVILKKDEETGRYELIRNASPGETGGVLKNSRLYTYLGVQTDYTDVGKGLITPKMLTSVLAEAREL